MTTTHYAKFDILDASGETAEITIYNGAITALSLAGYLTQFGALRTALQSIILGVVRKEMWVGDETLISSVAPTDQAAQREIAWLVYYESTSVEGKIFRLHIACPDTSKLIPGTDLADLTDTQMAAFVTAFEAIAKAYPDDEEDSAHVLRIRLVGRDY